MLILNGQKLALVFKIAPSIVSLPSIFVQEFLFIERTPGYSINVTQPSIHVQEFLFIVKTPEYSRKVTQPSIIVQEYL